MSRKKETEVVGEKHVINKKYVLIIIGAVLIFLIVIGVVIFLNREDKTSNLPKENEIVEEDNTPVFEEKAIDEQKNILLDILNQEIAKYEEICIDSDNSECITEEKKIEILNTFNSFKDRLENEDVSQEEIELLKQEVNDYLVALDPEVKLDDLISEETEKEENNTTSEKEESNENSSSVASGIEGILNSAKLNPIKTGYTSLDNQVSSVINSVTNSSMSTYEKVKALYDWVINNMSYQIGFVIGEEIDSLMNTYGFYERDAIQVFLASNGFGTKRGSCDNYSAMFMILTRRIGLDSYVVSARNTNGTGHTTVNIKINGKWYNFDPQREDNSKKNGKIMYYAFGEDDSDSKPYTYVNRNSDVAAFHKFNKQPESNYLNASITVAGKTYSAKTLVQKYNLTIPETFEINYVNNPNTVIKLEVDRNVTYMWTNGGYTNLDWEHSSIDGKATTSRYGEVTINQTYSANYNYTIHIVDENGREINFIMHFNFRDSSKKLSISANVGDYSYNDYFLVGVSSYDSIGNVNYTAKVIETNDPRGVGAVVIEPSYSYTFKISNLDRSNYWYKIEITGTDEAGNVATDVVSSISLID
ncbi:MAG TPA: transglutaminase domain-containing protein [Candidatus Onthocola stercoravium]|nr:transglutaminase domain-containing protein [Candidatus Onthocola stercoravium]